MIMDYMVFFKELKSEFERRGLGFRYQPDIFAYGNPFGKFKKSVKLGAKNNLFFVDKVSDKNKSDMCSNLSKWIPFKNGCHANPFSHSPEIDDYKIEIFFGLPDMVYRIALNLAKKIGRLPDALHARMIFSTDEHAAVKTYIRRYAS